MAAVGVSRIVGIVLEEANCYRRAFFTQALFCPTEARCKNRLARLIVGYELEDVIALWRRILRMSPAV